MNRHSFGESMSHHVSDDPRARVVGSIARDCLAGRGREFSKVKYAANGITVARTSLCESTVSIQSAKSPLRVLFSVNGGRFNRPGVEALYLSPELETALAEYRQAATITPPATLVACRVDVEGVVDFSGGYDPGAWSDDWAEMGCDWKYIARIELHDPPTCRVGDALIRDWLKGLLFPSYRRSGGTNLVLFNANLRPADHLTPPIQAANCRAISGHGRDCDAGSVSSQDIDHLSSSGGGSVFGDAKPQQ